MMVARRSRGEGSLFWHEKRQRWIGVVSQGYAANGKRRTTWVKRENEDRGKDQAAGGAASSGRWSASWPPRLHGAASCRVMAGAWSGGAGSEHGDEPDDLGPEAPAAGLGVSPAGGADGR